MKPSSSAMTVYGIFVQYLIPLEDEKEEKSIKD